MGCGTLAVFALQNFQLYTEFFAIVLSNFQYEVYVLYKHRDFLDGDYMQFVFP